MTPNPRQANGPALDPVSDEVVAGGKRPFVYYLGKALLWMGYAALLLAGLVSCVGMTKFGLAVLIGVWASVVLVPIIVIGHVLVRFGAADAW
jgi:hypothetical protein